jgi:hypothetical protein
MGAISDIPAKNDLLAETIVWPELRGRLLWRPRFGRPLAKLFQRPLSLRAIAGLELIGYGAFAPNATLRRYCPIDGSKGDLKFVDFIPLGLGALSLGNREKLLQALMRRIRL